MKITVNEDKVMQLEEVFNSILLKTPDGEKMYICMRDSGFEFTYEGKKYSAQKGVIKEVLIITSSNSIENNNCSPYGSDELKK
jgi:hypothetical protein